MCLTKEHGEQLVNKATTEEPRVLNATEAAAFLRVSNNTLYELCRRNEIPHRRAGRKFLFLLSSLEEYVRGVDQG